MNLIALPSRLSRICRRRVTSPDDRRRQSLVDQAAESSSFSHARGGDQVQRRLDAFAQVERLALEVELAGLDLREVEDVVDDRQQRVAARADGLGEVALLARSSRVSSSRPVMPMTPFIGVRISWLMVARNALLACVAASAS